MGKERLQQGREFFLHVLPKSGRQRGEKPAKAICSGLCVKGSMVICSYQRMQSSRRKPQARHFKGHCSVLIFF
ncbi:MAG: hypothetical protein B5M56_10195 [Desulfococcus sp. 4484_241]|nr:MAG: hypothetical protein B5M56_10195 [Desulfococcus sp. 4484_241]